MSGKRKGGINPASGLINQPHTLPGKLITRQIKNNDKNKQLFDNINSLAESKQATPAQISLAWMICKKPWIVTHSRQHKDQMPMSDVFGGANS